MPFTWHLAHPADVAAYLARHEDGLRAMDAVLPAAGAHGGAAAVVDDLSLKTISEDTSPVVKLVHSTLYDALKVGASDIHLETEGDGLSIRYRIDGVLNAVGTLNGAGSRRAGDLAHQGHVGARHRRAPHSAGRPLPGVGARARDRLPRLGDAEHLRRGCRGADPRQAVAVGSRPRPEPGAARIQRGGEDRDPPSRERALRHAARHRPDRQRQDHDALRDHFRDQPRRRQDHHHRGSGRIPVAGRAADSGEREEGPHVRARPALDPAPRSRSHHGGRDPRSGDGADRGAGGAHRAPRVHHGARQQRVRRDRPLHAHGCRPLQLRVCVEWDRGATTGARAVHCVQRGRRAGRRAARPLGTRRERGARLPLPHRSRLRPVPRHRLPGPQGDRGDHGAHRRAARADRRQKPDPRAEGSRRAVRARAFCGTARSSS